MGMTEEDVLARQISESVESLLGAVLQNDAEAVAGFLQPGSFIDIGRQLFGLDALVVPMGFAARPQQLGLSAIQAGDGVAIAELRGLDDQEETISVCSIFLSGEDGAWQVEDILPVAAEEEFNPEEVEEPTGQFYTGDLQLEVRDDAALDAVETLLVPGLQQEGVGLHLLERGVHLWRTFRDAANPPLADPAAWAAGLHMTVLLLDQQPADPTTAGEAYGVSPDLVAERFMAVATTLGFQPEAGGEEPPPLPQPRGSGLLDASGRPIGGPSGDGRGRGPGGLILPS